MRHMGQFVHNHVQVLVEDCLFHTARVVVCDVPFFSQRLYEFQLTKEDTLK